MDKVQKASDSECYTPPSEPFRFQFQLFFIKIDKKRVASCNIAYMFSIFVIKCRLQDRKRFSDERLRNIAVALSFGITQEINRNN
jgi:hypothetical protein